LAIGKPEGRKFDGMDFTGPGFLYLRDDYRESETGASIIIVVLSGGNDYVITDIGSGNICGRKSYLGVSFFVIFLFFSLAR
jgi:hypothetical protein